MRNYCGWCHQADEPLLLPGNPPVRNSPNSLACPQCRREIALIQIHQACKIVGVSRKTMYQWIDKGQVSAVRSASGRLLICFSSLFGALKEEIRERVKTDKPA
jgi:excisionase family DNA binding protein